MTLVTAADHAAQVIEGRVIHRASRWAENPRRIETVITFGDVRFHKGGPIGGGEDGTFELVVPGGSIGGVEMRIAGAPELLLDDRWVLFLLPTYKTYPVVGMTTGAFRVIESTDGTTEVRDAAGHAIGLIRNDGTVVAAESSRVAAEIRLVGAERLRLRPEPQKVTRPMSHDEFADAIRPILAVSRQHAIPHPAGRPEPTALMPSAIRSSQLEQRTSQARSGRAQRGRVGTPSSAPAPDRRGRR